MKLELGDHTVQLDATDLTFSPIADHSVCGGSRCCMSTIQPATEAVGLRQGQWILGIPALRGSYIGLNYETNTIGLAPQA